VSFTREDFRFTPENIRYCLLAWDPYEAAETNEFGQEPLPISGLFNWAKALNGKREMPRSREEFDAFNIIHVNVTARNLFLIPQLLTKIDKSKTRILANVDFSVELWNQNFHYPDSFIEYLDKCDYIFAVEPEMASVLSRILCRPVPYIPHPSDIEGIKTHHSEQRLQQIGVAAHRYDPNLVLPHLMLRDLPPGWQTVLSGMIGDVSPYYHLFTFAKPYSKFEEYIKFISQLYAVLETHTFHTYGRHVVECAALGVPVVGPSRIAAMKTCFPNTTADTFEEQHKFLNALIEYPDFYVAVAKYGMEHSELYSLRSSASRMLSFLNGTLEQKEGVLC